MKLKEHLPKGFKIRLGNFESFLLEDWKYMVFNMCRVKLKGKTGVWKKRLECDVEVTVHKSTCSRISLAANAVSLISGRAKLVYYFIPRRFCVDHTLTIALCSDMYQQCPVTIYPFISCTNGSKNYYTHTNVLARTHTQTKNKKQQQKTAIKIRIHNNTMVSSGDFFSKDKQNWSTWEHKEAVCVIHSADESVNKQNIKVFTDKTFATTVAKDNIQSN